MALTLTLMLCIDMRVSAYNLHCQNLEERNRNCTHPSGRRCRWIERSHCGSAAPGTLE